MKVERFASNPIIRPRMDSRMGDNVNGPSLIRVPAWVRNPLGRYYLYFAHHDGHYIRLAYADDLRGPWRTHEPGVLPLADSHFAGHIASPDVHVDDQAQRIRMYFHGADQPSGARGSVQHTRVALSDDGVTFTAAAELLGRPYFRAFSWGGYVYALGMPGVLYRSKDGLTAFEEGPTLFTPNMRHSAFKLDGDTLSVFYTNAGDAPEQILMSTIELAADWRAWRTTDPVAVLAPEMPYEGSDQPIEPSKRGLVHGPVHQLRDPAIFREDGRTYLLYSVAGEHGIAIAEITP
ncbi:MAG: hypothetical protein U0821_26515 [Chloroflexota bacterium]